MFSISKRSGTPFLLIALFALCSFGLLAFRNGFDMLAVWMALITLGLLLAQYVLLPLFFRHIDRVLMILVNVLAVIGLVIQFRLDAAVAFRQCLWFIIALITMVVTMLIMSRVRSVEGGVKWYMIGGIILLALTMIFGKVTNGALNWLSFSGFSIQPSEFGKVILVVVLAGVLREKRHFGGYLILFAFVAACMGLLVMQKDLGAALLYFGTFVVMLYVGTSNLYWVAGATGMAVLGSVASYYLFDHVRLRVHVWRNPWSQADGGGYQIIQGLMAIASGGLFGRGLGMGSPRFVPEYRTDYIFAAVCEEMGLVVGLIIIAFYLFILFRGIRVARRATDAFQALLALGATITIVIQAFIILGGVTKMIPLTGITLPFISYGGSSMVVTMIMVGILQSVAIHEGKQADETLPEGGEEEA